MRTWERSTKCSNPNLASSNELIKLKNTSSRLETLGSEEIWKNYQNQYFCSHFFLLKCLMDKGCHFCFLTIHSICSTSIWEIRWPIRVHQQNNPIKLDHFLISSVRPLQIQLICDLPRALLCEFLCHPHDSFSSSLLIFRVVFCVVRLIWPNIQIEEERRGKERKKQHSSSSRSNSPLLECLGQLLPGRGKIARKEKRPPPLSIWTVMKFFEETDFNSIRGERTTRSFREKADSILMRKSDYPLSIRDDMLMKFIDSSSQSQCLVSQTNRDVKVAKAKLQL